METTVINKNTKCRVNLDWGDGSHRGKHVQVLSLQKHGLETFAKVMWLGNSSQELTRKFGNLFNVRELVLV